MSSDTQKCLPLPVRDTLTDLGKDAPPDAHEFSARLHRRLVSAGAPPVPGWLDRARELWRTLGHDTPQKRSLLTGAILGALATATTFLLLSGGHPLRGAGPARPGDETSSLDGAPSALPGGVDRHGQHAVGDHRPTRDRLGEDIGAERPERPEHLHVEPLR
jgi:hypothetical protein